ncbi:acyl-CoA dehydrogenase family protein [Paraburkholderia caballeronis]|uniref:Acyl-CoA dehydrogenase n=1 Tax=Paraburkholderia caballeronis TaxID=416943 RepID=A0A1H7FPS6_9BURK|nr:acyl-CoA dehydrogenase family protein [Paraburkholderia caballeronis]PXW24889.1 alkylation response protein AidB-like acyl-CoA dehydrogenase [Paraburkholderia caballeronis]PXX00619.1 alkylation response protein AidB-like acyl-CoA dehydrogenase [Paraburkholderia caballeronis]RAJ98682.1 alkylation response protein AidB-like acyl-CoA dehydrogenase [Paraburkholderia caballeronis]SEE69977.1 Acyl-CoA dehydrogenase [Paraburkholderia caballeronis]SEK27968.1 Acyl-CoA dehydrogenase [Paraburkholderia 
MNVLQTLEPIVRDVIAPAAADTDQHARYPRAALRALGQAGLLGLVSARAVGGLGGGLPEAVQAVERIARDCPCTAMVLTMHYCGVALIEPFAGDAVRRAIADGRHVTTLAVSEAASRSHIWAPAGTASEGDGPDDAGTVRLNALKSMITSAGEADSYVWISRATHGEGNTLWLVDSRLPGLAIPSRFDGMGLRGNASSPIEATDVRVPRDCMLGADGEGEPIKARYLMPFFPTLIATTSIGLMQGALQRAVAHVSATRFSDTGSTLGDLPTIRAWLARAWLQAEQARLLRDATVASVVAGDADTRVRLLQVKAAAAEAALSVTEIAMRVCGGAAFRKEAGIERLFRDARAASVMAPTTDVLYDMLGKALGEGAAIAPGVPGVPGIEPAAA